MFSGFSICTNSPIKWHSRGQRFGSTNSEKVKALYDRICKIAQGAALMTETQVEIVFDKACSNVLSDSVLEQLLYDKYARSAAASVHRTGAGFYRPDQRDL